MYPEKMLRLPGLVALLFYAAAAPAQTNPDLCKEVPAIAEELTQISGMRLLRPVPCDFITKAKINEFLPTLDRMMASGLITLEKVQVLRYGTEGLKERAGLL